MKINYLCSLLLLFIFACGKAVDEDRKNVISSVQQAFHNDFQNASVLVVSEQNCSTCIEDRVMALKEKAKKGKPILGLIYRYTQKKSADLARLKAKTDSFIIWKEDSNIQLMKSLSNISGMKSGPYLISFKTGEIQEVIELNGR